MHKPQAEIEWRDGNVPVSTQFDDPYFSLENGLAETCHVFLAGNDLPARFCDGFHIAELGFGTGLNFLATLRAWSGSSQKGQLYYTSFEAFPMSLADITLALQAFPEIAVFAEAFLEQWPPQDNVVRVGSSVLTIVPGDARKTLPKSDIMADAWFLDGFSPAKNPELWEPDLMHAVAAHTRSGGTLATYTAAGFVRRGLQDAGFDVERVPGYGRKRHMTKATLP